MADVKSPKTPAPEKDWTILVEAHRPGTYPQPGRLNAWLRQPGDRFLIKNRSHFADAWMTIPGEQPTGEATVSANGVAISGHGPAKDFAGVPMTTVQNEVKDPMSIMMDLAGSGQASRGR